MKSNYDKKQNVIFGVLLAVSLVALGSTTAKLIKKNNQKLDEKIQVVANNYDEIKKLVEKDKAEVLYNYYSEDLKELNFNRSILDFSQMYIMLQVDEGQVSDTFFISSIYEEAYVDSGNSYGVAIVGSDRCGSPEQLYSTNIDFYFYSNSFKMVLQSSCGIYVDPETVAVDYDNLLVNSYFYSVIGIY